MRYKKTDSPIEQIGRELGVEYVLDGSAQKQGSRIRIAVELIKVKDPTLLWADSYEQEMSGVNALQNEVAQTVTRALAIKLLPSEQATLAKARSVNPEAYEVYLKGSFYWKKSTIEGFDIAEKCFDLAIEKDPSCALAYTGRVWVWLYRNQ